MESVPPCRHARIRHAGEQYWRSLRPVLRRNQPTTYRYDALDNLTDVNQGGQARQFEYDSLKRLRVAANPESGTTTYQYDANSNLISRVDASGVTTCYGSGGANCDGSGYDSLNRVTRVSYSDSTPTAQYCYDGYTYVNGSCGGTQAANQWLRKTAAGNSVSFTTYTYDRAGRLTSSAQTTGGVPYTLSYGYYNDDRLASMRYPSQRVVTTCYDRNGRASWVSKDRTVSDCTNLPGDTKPAYASVALEADGKPSYFPPGEVKQLNLGNGLVETANYNNRLQPLSMTLGGVVTFDLEYGGANNNGNPLSQTITVPGATSLMLKQYYRYDGVNRLTLVAEYAVSTQNPACPDAASQWCQGFGYDSYGNRSITARTGASPSPLEPAGIDSGTNRNTPNMPISPTSTGWSYSTAGNIVKDPTAATYAYDAENRQKAYCRQDPGGCLGTAGAGRTLYLYDAEGRRVQVQGANGTSTVFVYDGMGNLVGEYWLEAQPGQANTMYLTADHLGSTRVITDQNGGCLERRDYLPFGQDILVTPASARYGVPCYSQDAGIRQRFTGKERDAETGLDFFEARYFSSAQGRFTSTDPVISGPHKVDDPQNWNLYAYARNNPLRFTDPSGEIIVENIDDEYRKRYEQWKKAYLATNAGQQQWNKYANDPNFTLTITFDKVKKQGAETGNYQWDSSGNLTAATISLGPKLGSGYPSAVGYPVTSSLQGAGISGTVLAVTKFAHEFGHVNRTGQENAALFQLQNQLIPQYNSIFFSNGQNVNDPALKALEQRMGGTPIDINLAREHWAEANTIPYLRDRFPGKSVPNQIKQAIQDYQKAFSGRVP